MRIATGFLAVTCLLSINNLHVVAGECQHQHAGHHIQATQVVHHGKHASGSKQASGSKAALADIVDTAVGAKSFNTLVAAVKAGGLVDTLKGKGPFTVFAPTDEAFAKLPKGTVETLLKPENKQKLVSILTYHVVPGKLPASRVTQLAAAQTVQGEMLPFKVEKGAVRIGTSTVAKANIHCSNGVIHVINSVLLPPKMAAGSGTKEMAKPAGSDVKPMMKKEEGSAKKPLAGSDKKMPAMTEPDIVDVAMSAGNFKTLVAAVKAAGLVETLKGDGPFTVFAPTDEAFAKIPAETIASLLKPENKAQLTKILTYHVVPGKVMAADVVKLSNAKTVQGSEVSIATKEGAVMIDGAKVLKADIVTRNGVIHVIDSVIMP